MVGCKASHKLLSRQVTDEVMRWIWSLEFLLNNYFSMIYTECTAILGVVSGQVGLVGYLFLVTVHNAHTRAQACQHPGPYTVKKGY